MAESKILHHWPYCERCRQPFAFEPNEPFAHCGCGTTEWGDPRPASWIPDPAKASVPLDAPLPMPAPERPTKEQAQQALNWLYHHPKADGVTEWTALSFIEQAAAAVPDPDEPGAVKARYG